MRCDYDIPYMVDGSDTCVVSFPQNETSISHKRDLSLVRRARVAMLTRHTVPRTVWSIQQYYYYSRSSTDIYISPRAIASMESSGQCNGRDRADAVKSINKLTDM